MNLIWHETGTSERCHLVCRPRSPAHWYAWSPRQALAAGRMEPPAASHRVHHGAEQVCWRLARQRNGRTARLQQGTGHAALSFWVLSPPSLGCLHPRLMLAVGTRPGGAVWHRGAWKHPWKKQPENSAALSLLRPSLYNSHLFAGLCVWRERWGIKG